MLRLQPIASESFLRDTRITPFRPYDWTVCSEVASMEQDGIYEANVQKPTGSGDNHLQASISL